MHYVLTCYMIIRMSTKNKLITPIVQKPIVKRIHEVPQGAIPYDAKTIIVTLCLLFIYPFGIILMWIWMVTWNWWLRLIITIPLLLGIVCVFVIRYTLIK